jgi:hypothetical protein
VGTDTHGGRCGGVGGGIDASGPFQLACGQDIRTELELGGWLGRTGGQGLLLPLRPVTDALPSLPFVCIVGCSYEGADTAASSEVGGGSCKEAS